MNLRCEDLLKHSECVWPTFKPHAWYRKGKVACNSSAFLSAFQIYLIPFSLSGLFSFSFVFHRLCFEMHMYFTGVPLSYNCSNTEKRKINVPIIPALFFAPSGICISTNWVPERTEYICKGWFGIEDGISRWHS